MKQIFFSVFFAVALLFSGTVAHAALTNEQVDAVLSLLRSFGAEESIVANVELSLRGSQECPFLTMSMSRGSVDETTNGEVSIVQRYLGVEPVSGYFGPITEAAVRQFQSTHGVVSSGTPDTTGYGVVGPKTRAKILEVCEAAKLAETPSPSNTQTENTTQTTYTPPPTSVPSTSTQTIVGVDQTSQTFFDAVYEAGVESGLTSLELNQVNDVLSNLTEAENATSTEETESGLSIDLESLVSSLVNKAIEQILAEANQGATCGTPGLDFGTPMVTKITPCSCSGTVLVHMQPTAPNYVTKLSYRPGSQQCENFNIPQVGQALVGKYVPQGVCLVPSGSSCSYVPHDGMIVPGTGSSLR